MNNKEIALDDIIEIIVEKLEAGGTVTFTPNGNSMYPMLRDGEDVVVLTKPKGRLHLFDLPLYRRDNGKYVLHRVIDFDRYGNYVMCGDNQFARERGIRDDQIIGVVTAFYRKGKPYTMQSLRYRAYVNFWYYTRPFRHTYRFGATRAKRVFGSPKPKQGANENSEKN